MATNKSAPVNWEGLLTGIARGKTVVEYGADRRIFDQKQPADSIFYVRKGKVKLSVISQQGKQSELSPLMSGRNEELPVFSCTQ